MTDKTSFTHMGLFEGIGGFSLAARWMGWETKAWCEWNEFGQKVLRHHFPEAEGFGDITKTDFTKYANRIDVLTGGFPCQPFSAAGEQRGEQDERFLFPEMLRAIREIKPRWVVAENVNGISTPKFKEVLNEIYASLEAEKYQILPCIIPATSVGANHERYRTFFIAHSKRIGLEESTERQFKPHTVCDREKTSNSFASCTAVGRLYGQRNYTKIIRDNGIPFELDGITFSEWRKQSLKAAGNAIVPQVAFEIFKAIQAYTSTI